MVQCLQCQNPECRAIGQRSDKTDLAKEVCLVCGKSIKKISRDEFDRITHWVPGIPFEPDMFNKEFQPGRHRPRLVPKGQEPKRKEKKQAVLFDETDK